MIESLKYRILWLKRIIFSLISFLILNSLIISVSANPINSEQSHHTGISQVYTYDEIESSVHMEVGHTGGLSRVLSGKVVRPDIESLAGVTSVAAKTSTTALRKVGSVLESVDDVMANPNLLKGKSPLQVEGILGKTPGWRIETLGQGSQKGNGWVLRQYNAKGNPTGPQLRWHPGGGHHGPTPYWRVVGPNGDLGGIIR